MLKGEKLGAAIEAARIKKGVSKAELARQFKVKAPSVQGWVKNGRISKDTLAEVITYFSDAVGPEHWGLDNSSPFVNSGGESKGEIMIPQYNTGGMGGHGLVLKDQPGVIQNWNVSRDWLQANVPHHTSVNNLCIVTGFGDSMPETYSPGDPLIVDLGVTVCDHDGIYFFRVGDEGFIKRLQRIPGQGILVLSQNKEYRDWTITPDMDFEVFGKVLRAWKGRNY